MSEWQETKRNETVDNGWGSVEDKDDTQWHAMHEKNNEHENPQNALGDIDWAGALRPSEAPVINRRDLLENMQRQEKIERKLNESFTSIEELEARMDSGEAGSTKEIVYYEGKPITIYNTGNIPFNFLNHGLEWSGGMGAPLMDDPTLWNAPEEEAKKRMSRWSRLHFSNQLSMEYVDSIKQREIASQGKDYISYGMLHMPSGSLSQTGGATGALVKERSVISLPDPKVFFEKIANEAFFEMQNYRYNELGNPWFHIDFIRAPRGGITKETLRQAAIHDAPIFIIPREQVTAKEERAAEEKRKDEQENRRIEELCQSIIDAARNGEKAKDVLEQLISSPYDARWVQALDGSKTPEEFAELRKIILSRREPHYNTVTEDGFEANKKAALERINNEIGFQIEQDIHDANLLTNRRRANLRDKLEKMALSANDDLWDENHKADYAKLYSLVRDREQLEASRYKTVAEERFDASKNDELKKMESNISGEIVDIMQRKETLALSVDERAQLRSKLKEISNSANEPSWTPGSAQKYATLFRLTKYRDRIRAIQFNPLTEKDADWLKREIDSIVQEKTNDPNISEEIRAKRKELILNAINDKDNNYWRQMLYDNKDDPDYDESLAEDEEFYAKLLELRFYTYDKDIHGKS